MKRKLVLYLASSLNGKIARANGSVDWLTDIGKLGEIDYGYSDFYNSIDTTVMGYSTYKHILDMDVPFPYSGKENYVITRNKDHQDTEHVKFINEDYASFISNLKLLKGKDIWLVGGGQVNTLFLNSGLIDELRLFIMPLILPDGIEMFGLEPVQSLLKLKKVNEFSNGAIELVYTT